MNENKFDSLHIDLDKWIFELNGEKMKNVTEIEFSIKKHQAQAILKISKFNDEQVNLVDTVATYRSRVIPRTIKE